MKKIKLAFMALATVAAVCSAFGAKQDPCTDCPQYHYLGGGSYESVGIWQYNYDCDQYGGGVCTYWRPDPIGHPNDYAPCRMGAYIYIQANTADKKK